jgi:glutathione peroxidase-family protein
MHDGYGATMSRMYDLTMTSITGDDVALADYRGKVCLIVNVASL